MGKLLTHRQQCSFQEQGVAFPVRVLAAAEAERYRQACDSLELQLGGRPRTIEVRQMHLHFSWAYSLATHPHVLDAVEDLLGPNLLVWATELFAKHPREAAVSIGWHRDGPYMGLDPDRTMTAWIALSASHRENGCMRVVREANRKESPHWNARQDQILGRQENRVPDVPDQLLDDIALEAGEMSLHDVYVLHGSGPNRGEDKRVGFAIRFTTPECRPAAGRPPAVLARGEDRYGHFELQDPPDGIHIEAALDQMRKSARQHLDATLQNLKQLAPR
ncbi:MAG TPA: phytanoyl-CoA dioxygenase family protein [Polyangiaceae bacterium]